MILKIVFILLSTLCGTDNVPITNGKHGTPIEPPIEDYPFLANILIKNEQRPLHLCGGSLIHEKWVLTASHCTQFNVENTTFLNISDITVAFGSTFTNGVGGQFINVKNIFANEEYFTERPHNDIALMELENPVVIDPKVNIVRLEIDVNNIIGNMAYLVGYGYINERRTKAKRFRRAKFTIGSKEQCLIQEEFEDAEICAMSKIKDGKACHGDSGGPLFIIKNNIIVQIGVTSRTSLLPICALPFNHSIYTRVSAYIDWISNITGIDFRKYNQI